MLNTDRPSPALGAGADSSTVTSHGDEERTELGPEALHGPAHRKSLPDPTEVDRETPEVDLGMPGRLGTSVSTD